MLLPRVMHSSTEATGITEVALLYNAAAIVDVALKTSIITTTDPSVSYRCSRAGDKQTSSLGNSLFINTNYWGAILLKET
jgi:hypothetical protein